MRGPPTGGCRCSRGVGDGGGPLGAGTVGATFAGFGPFDHQGLAHLDVRGDEDVASPGLTRPTGVATVAEARTAVATPRGQDDLGSLWVVSGVLGSEHGPHGFSGYDQGLTRLELELNIHCLESPLVSF